MRARLAIAFLLACSTVAAQQEIGLEESARPVREMVPGWKPPKKIVVVVDTPQRAKWLQFAAPGVKIIGVTKVAEVEAQVVDADAAVLVGCRAETFRKAPKLKWIHASSGGSERCLEIPAVAKGDIVLTDSRKVKNTILTEMAMGYVYALARSIDVAVVNQQKHDLNARGRPAMQLEGGTMLVVGLGGAGTEIARQAHEIGMKVIATRNSSRSGPDFVEYVGLANELPKLVERADVVMIAAPLTPQTRGLFDKAMFARMKRGAMLVNWSRADIVKADDLAAALSDGQLGSAALNWASTTPLPKDHPLWTAPNLILAPWTGTGGGADVNEANQTPQQLEQRWNAVRENIRRFAAGDKMLSVFDLSRGY
jgi:phosphoglycerate dehydrogenase-like enzyme